MTAITRRTRLGRGAQKPSARLAPYLPRLLLDWLTEAPNSPYREIEGTVAFVDISGFTAMSERLARRGKEGAEELTDILNNVFSELLTLAQEDGGELLKFGGDALLLFFSGHRHEVRACHAAARMRAALRTVGRVRTSSGVMQLRMSIGVHSGLFHFFLAGTRHRELVVTGPAHTRTVEMESTAEAGEILLSKEAASALPTRCLGKTKGEGILLRRRPPHVAHGGGESLVSDHDIEHHLPEILQAHLAEGAGSAEHRQAAVAFVHFTGADDVIRESGAAELHQRLEKLLSVVQDAAARYEVAFLSTDVAKNGGKVILTAGAPLNTGADEEALLQTVRLIADAECGLDLAIGVNRGRVFSGEIGPAFRKTYTIIGDAVNLTARVMAKAGHGEVLATPEVLERSHVVFETEALEPFMVKGKSQPVTAYRLGGVRGRRDRYEPGDLPFVGRDDELSRLLAAAQTASDGHGRLVQIVGEAGIGKSRLADELRRNTGEMRQLTAGAELYEATTPYFVFRKLICQLLEVAPGAPPQTLSARLRKVVRQSAPELAPVLPLIAGLLEISIPDTPATLHMKGEHRRARLHDAVLDLLARLLPEPSLIILEDLHWIDEASAEVLSTLTQRLDSVPWLVCATSRPPGRDLQAPGADVVTVIAVDALQDSALAQMAQAAAESLLIPPQQLAVAVKRAGGSPLFLQELLAASTSGAEEGAVPDRLESLIAARIDRLSPADRKVLRYASVIGASISGDLLQEVSGESGLPRGLRGFVVEESGGLRFRHALFRDTAYEGLPYRERRALHERIGDLIEARAGERADEQAEILSLHFYRGRQMEKAWHYSITAGAQARAHFANLEAAQFYERALDVGRRMKVEDRELGGIAEALGDVSELAGRFQQASNGYKMARKLMRSRPSVMVYLAEKEGIVRERSSRYSAALRWYAKGMKLLPRLSTPEQVKAARVRLSNATMAARFRQGRFRECTRVGLEVLADAETLDDRGLLAHTLFLLGASETYLKNLVRNHYLERALPIYEGIGDFVGQANVLNNMGVDAYYDGRWDEARDCYERSRAAREVAGDVVGAATASNNIGEILSDQGRKDEAERLFREALTVWRATAYPVGVALATSNLGRLCARSGRHEEAAKLFEEALAGFRAIGAGSFVLDTQAKMAENLVFACRGEEATQLVDQLIQETRGVPGTFAVRALLYRVRAYALLQSGTLGDARVALELSLSVAREAGAEFEAALTLEALSHAAAQMRESRQSEYLLEAQKILQRLGVGTTPRVPLPPISDRPDALWHVTNTEAPEQGPGRNPRQDP